ncbi:MAG: hypothetical protein HC844_03525 [Tabrizicola sp.]|nr:hypothetical protein [Tabrizicola sp.]
MRETFCAYLLAEDGAVTVDWVVLTAGVVGVAIVATPPIVDAVWQLGGHTKEVIDAIEVGLPD